MIDRERERDSERKRERDREREREGEREKEKERVGRVRETPCRHHRKHMSECFHYATTSR